MQGWDLFPIFVKQFKTIETMSRSLNVIANEIRADWKKVNYAAEPYLSAMSGLESITDKYYQDSARSVVLYFLCNAGTWRGEVAKKIKAELNKMIK